MSMSMFALKFTMPDNELFSCHERLVVEMQLGKLNAHQDLGAGMPATRPAIVGLSQPYEVKVG